MPVGHHRSDAGEEGRRGLLTVTLRVEMVEPGPASDATPVGNTAAMPERNLAAIR